MVSSAIALARSAGAATRRCRALAGVLLLGLAASACHPRVALVTPLHSRTAGLADQAVQHYTKALRGACVAMEPGRESKAFRTLAKTHLQAVRMRKAHNFKGAGALYRRVVKATKEGRLDTGSEVCRSVAAAHTSLNLALTEQALKQIPAARKAFQDGVALVQELLRQDFDAWVDGSSQVRTNCALHGKEGDAVQRVVVWLATLLTSWALLESKCGRQVVARLLVQRAASLDQSKDPVLRWQVMYGDLRGPRPSETRAVSARSPTASAEVRLVA